MNKSIILTALAAVLISGNVMSQTITANDVAIAPGKTSTLTVSLQTPVQSGVVEFYLDLPEGIEIDEDGSGFKTSRGSLLNGASMMDVKEMDDGSYRFECIPSTSKGSMQTSTGEYSGSIVSISLKAGRDVANGTYDGSTSRIIAVKPGGGDTNTTIGDIADCTFKINVSEKGTAGISGIAVDKLAKDGKVYNIQGQRVSNTIQSGLYIVDGKKVVVR